MLYMRMEWRTDYNILCILYRYCSRRCEDELLLRLGYENSTLLRADGIYSSVRLDRLPLRLSNTRSSATAEIMHNADVPKSVI